MTGSRESDRVGGTRCQIDIDGHGSYGWRMIAQNGRVVAVSGLAFREYGDCLAAFERLRTDSARLVGAVQHSAEGNGWVWLLRDGDGRPIAVSARAYERHSTCRSAYERFRGLLGSSL
ncbi:hypothetical protein [Streptomyces sp. NPDC050504]|uniref:hypothetical protein n=1 Tax=Streptomyces sp. NPDC050504 TaxID=3365618 RepID=UPI0037B72F60